ncbi:hypothetical protein ACQRBF_04415 [Peptoniphilaceae bacterium SGI.131]
MDLKEGLYCSGLAYTAYKNNGIIIPGPEYGNLEEAMSLGPQSGRVSRGGDRLVYTVIKWPKPNI